MKKIDWAKTIFVVLVIMLSYLIGKNTNERDRNKKAYEDAAYLANNELTKIQERIASRDSLIKQLEAVIEQLEK
ncbi:MAG: hypothetical protein AAGA66_00345 [Bacteroidota bacterium]